MLRHVMVLGVRIASLKTRDARRSIAALVFAGFFGLLGLADFAAAAANVGPVSGVVVDPAGKPVAGAKVWLVGADMFFFDAPRTLAEATTDEKGRFTVPAVKERSGPAGYPPMLAARDARGRLGAAEFGMAFYMRGAVSSAAKITLWEGKDCEGRMIDAAGKPIAKASVAPLFRVSDRSSSSGYSMVVLPVHLQKELTATTDADGRFRIKHFPASGMLYTRIRAGEFGEPLAMMNFGKSVTVRLSRPGDLHLTATCPKDPKAVAGLPFFVASSNIDSDPSEKGAVMLYYFHEVKTQADGTFVLAKIPPGKYMVLSKFPATLPYRESTAVSAEVKSGETAREKVVLVPAVKLQGKVADRATSKGVAGVRVALFDNMPVFREAVTDAQGMFTIYVKPGAVRVFVSQVPEPYVTPGMENMATVNAAEGVKASTLLLDRTMPVEALVVDSAGQPIADAKIRIASSSEDRWGNASEKVLRSDAAGKVALGDFVSKQTVSIRARAKNAAAPLKTVAVARQHGPIRLVLSEKTAFVLRGTLADDAGTPIAAANLKLLMFQPQPPASTTMWATSRHSREEESANLEGTGITVQECDKVNADGTFALAGLWPDVQYRLLVKLPGHERYASAMLQAAADKTRDLGKIVLARTVETVEGTVLDTAGKPIAGVRVFNAGDGPDPMETTTDAAGRFRLAGFRKGTAYIFAMKDGRQFAGLRTKAGAADATVTMLHNDEPAPKRPIEAAALSPDEQKKLALALLEKAWDIVKEKKKSAVGNLRQALLGIMGSNGETRKDIAAGQRAHILELMRKIDPEQAKRRESESSAKTSMEPPTIRPPDREDAARQTILKTAEDDIDDALSMLDKDPERSVRQLRGLTDHFAEKDRAKALRCAEEGVVRARSLDQPSRTTEVVSWGETIARLGNKAAARKLIEEAADTADRWKTNSRYDQAFGAIAVALAPYDAARAGALLKKLSNEYYQRAYRTQVATAIDDLKQVETLLKDADAETKKSVRLQWAYRAAPTRPAEAVHAVEGLLEQGKQAAAENMSPYYARLAELIGTHDSALARSLIDRSMAGLLRAKPATDEATGRSAAVLAARLAVVARKVGYGDMEGMVLRVLALRPTPGKSDSPFSARETTLGMAEVLALTDPASVRPILRTLEPTAETIEDRAAWLRAWALADPQHAAEIAEKELAKAKSGGDPDRAVDAVVAVVRLWTLSPDERIKAVLPDYGKNTETGRRGVPGEPFGYDDVEL